ncbi:unnamed protein product, partial [Brassica rapa subsp. trilocularis]
GSYSTRTLFPFFSCRDSVYPIGSETRALNFFTVFMKPRAWLTDEVGDLTFDTYLAFQMLWSHQHMNWKKDSFLPGATFHYFYGYAPRYAQTLMW